MRILKIKAHDADADEHTDASIPLVAAICAMLVAQVLKIFTTWFETNRWDFSKVFKSGGMPSSHSAAIFGLTAAVGVLEGFTSTAFCIAFILALIIAYDAANVRFIVGQHSHMLNALAAELPLGHPARDVLRPGELLKTQVGHTVSEVLVGCVVGVVCGIAVQTAALSQ